MEIGKITTQFFNHFFLSKKGELVSAVQKKLIYFFLAYFGFHFRAYCGFFYITCILEMLISSGPLSIDIQNILSVAVILIFDLVFVVNGSTFYHLPGTLLFRDFLSFHTLQSIRKFRKSTKSTCSIGTKNTIKLAVLYFSKVYLGQCRTSIMELWAKTVYG